MQTDACTQPVSSEAFTRGCRAAALVTLFILAWVFFHAMRG